MFFFSQAGEYVSILIDNGTGSALTILQDSLFSGILIGVWGHKQTQTNDYKEAHFYSVDKIHIFIR